MEQANNGDEQAIKYVEYIDKELKDSYGTTLRISGAGIYNESVDLVTKGFELSGSDANQLSILLNSNIEYINDLCKSDVDIVLSGGTYGVKSVNSDYSKGIFGNHGATLFISGGIGGDIVRILNYPEIQLISVVEGDHQMQYSAYKEVAEKTFEFLETGTVTEKEEVVEVQEPENIEQDDNAVIENTTSENTIENTTVVVKIPANKPKEKEPEVAPITGNVLQNQTTTTVPEEPVKNETVEVPKVAEIQGGNPEMVEENKTVQEPEVEEIVEDIEEENKQEEIVNEVVNETVPDVPRDGNVIKLF